MDVDDDHPVDRGKEDADDEAPAHREAKPRQVGSVVFVGDRRRRAERLYLEASRTGSHDRSGGRAIVRGFGASVVLFLATQERDEGFVPGVDGAGRDRLYRVGSLRRRQRRQAVLVVTVCQCSGQASRPCRARAWFLDGLGPLVVRDGLDRLTYWQSDREGRVTG